MGFSAPVGLLREEIRVILGTLLGKTVTVSQAENASPLHALVKLLAPRTLFEYDKRTKTVTCTPGPLEWSYNATLTSHVTARGFPLEAAVILSLFGPAPLRIHLAGATYWGAPAAAFDRLYAPLIRLFSPSSAQSFTVQKHAFSEQPGGAALFTSTPVRTLAMVCAAEEQPLEWLDGAITSVRISSDFAKRAASTLRTELAGLGQLKITQMVYGRDSAVGEPGFECLLTAVGKGAAFYALKGTAAGRSITEHSAAPETVAKEAAEAFLADLERGGNFSAALLPFLIVLAALAEGTSELYCGTLTGDARAALEEAAAMLGTEWREQHGVLRIIGYGFANKTLEN